MYIRHAVYLLIIETNLPIVLGNKLFQVCQPVAVQLSVGLLAGISCIKHLLPELVRELLSLVESLNLNLSITASESQTDRVGSL